MAIKKMSLTCDNEYCYSTPEQEFEFEAEALEAGWFILKGPERHLGGNGEKVYCSIECLEQDL